jgi:hypothetical protein
LLLEFPQNALAAPNAEEGEISANEIRLMKSNGLTLYSSHFSSLGMTVFDDRFKLSNLNIALLLSESEQEKISIIANATRTLHSRLSLVSAFRSNFRLDESDFSKPILLFDSKKSIFYKNQSSAYSSKYLFVDQSFFSEATFTDAAREITLLHCQQFGSLKSEISSYALTEFLNVTLEAILQPARRSVLQTLKSRWESL